MKIHNKMYEEYIPDQRMLGSQFSGHLRIGPGNSFTALLINVQLYQNSHFGTLIMSYYVGSALEKVPVEWPLSSMNLEAIACHAMTKLFVIPAIPALRGMKCCQTCKHFKALNRNPVYIGQAFPGPACYPLIEDVFCLDSYACWEQSDA